MATPEFAFLVSRETDASFLDPGRFLYYATSLKPVYLFESLEGEALIERYADPSDPRSVVIALLTCDGGPRTGPDAANGLTSPEVAFSLGYFFARLPARNIIILTDGGHVPNQLGGVAQISMRVGDWRDELGRQLEDLGVAVDFSKI